MLQMSWHVVKPDDLHLLKSLLVNDVNGLIAPFVTHQKECCVHRISHWNLSYPIRWLFRLIDPAWTLLDRDKISLNLAGDLLEESQSEASRLRQRVEELVRDNEALKSSSFAASLCMGGPIQTETQSMSHRLDYNPEITSLIYFQIFWLHLACFTSLNIFCCFF